MRRVLDEGVERRPVDRHRPDFARRRPRPRSRRLPSVGDVGAPRLVGQLECLAVLAGDPGPLPRAAGEQLGRRRRSRPRRARRWGGGAPSAPAARAARRSLAARPGSPPRSPGIRPRRSGTRPALRPDSRGRGWASPRTHKLCQSSRPASIATGNGTASRSSPAATTAGSAPNGNRGAWTPIVLRPSSR